MSHQIHKVTGFERVAPITLRVEFADGSAQVIDFRPVLKGELYGPLQDPSLFDQVQLDPEAHTLVWPNGADFDTAHASQLGGSWTAAGSPRSILGSPDEIDSSAGASSFRSPRNDSRLVPERVTESTPLPYVFTLDRQESSP